MGSGGSDWKSAESQASVIVPSQTPPLQMQQSGLPHPGEYLRLHPLLCNRHTKQKNGPNERTDQSSRKNTTDEEMANLSDAEFKTLVIRMLTEMVQYGHKIEEKVKAMKSEIKESVQGTNSDGKETETQINGLDLREQINIQPEQNEETRIQKNEERLRNIQDIFKHSNIWIIGMPEEEEEQEIENLSKKKKRKLP